jgi:hypothetical protein
MFEGHVASNFPLPFAISVSNEDLSCYRFCLYIPFLAWFKKALLSVRLGGKRSAAEVYRIGLGLSGDISVIKRSA